MGSDVESSHAHTPLGKVSNDVEQIVTIEVKVDNSKEGRGFGRQTVEQAQNSFLGNAQRLKKGETKGVLRGGGVIVTQDGGDRVCWCGEAADTFREGGMVNCRSREGGGGSIGVGALKTCGGGSHDGGGRNLNERKVWRIWEMSKSRK